MTLLPAGPWLVTGVLAAACSGLLHAQDKPLAPGTDALTQATWAYCAKCHATPDARVQHDARWIGLNEATTCLTGEAAEPANRERLMAFLKAGVAPVAPLVQKSDQEDAAVAAGTHGLIRVPSTSGSAFLRKRPADSAAAGQTVDSEPTETLRLFWEAADEGSTLAIPVGAYELVGYCFYREDDLGRKWTAAATVQEGTSPDAIDVASSKPLHLPIAPTMFHDLNATADGPKLDIKFQMRNEAGDRMTLTRDGDLVKPSWLIYDEAGAAELASGRFVPS
ncbi:MAG: hypothetical protein ACI8WY_003962 [Planctomycetota bacterium]|jgi:hypothetical protein